MIKITFFGKKHSEKSLRKMTDSKKGTLTVLNIETDQVYRVPTEVYHNNREILFSIRSNRFKEWTGRHHK